MRSSSRFPLSCLVGAFLLMFGTFSYSQIPIPAAGIVSTVAGIGTQGFTGDGGLAAVAQISTVNSVAVDGSGNVYFADRDNFVIRKITAKTGIVTTVAGSAGVYGFAGDGGPALKAKMFNPQGIAVDAAGNLFIADTVNNRIRKVAADSGIITTIAGNGPNGPVFSGDNGPAINSYLNQPLGIVVDQAGSVYFCDSGNHRVRMIAASTGLITTVAGGGNYGSLTVGEPATSAVLSLPVGIALNNAGDLFIADAGLNSVIKVVASSGNVAIVAGNGTFGYAGDGKIATSANLEKPCGVAVDAAGNIYIADTGNNVVREVVASTGNITTAVGTGAAGLSGDGGLAGSADLNQPQGIILDTIGNLYIADTADFEIRVVGSSTSSQNASSTYTVTITSSDPKPTMGEAVTLTANVVNWFNAPASSGTVNWFNGNTPLGQSPVDSDGVATIATTVGMGGYERISANYSGTGSAAGTLGLNVYGYSLTGPSNPTISLLSGQSVQVQVNTTAFYGFTGPVSLTCSGLPSPAVCTVSSKTINFTNNWTAQNLTITIDTASVSTTAKATSPSGTGLVFAILCPFFLLGLKNKRFRSTCLSFLLVVCGALVIGTVGCGSSSTITPTPKPTPTTNYLPTGTYNVTITASSGTQTLKVPLTLVVK